MTLAELIIGFVQIWGAIGAVVCVLFLFIGIDRVDPAAHDAYAFRPLLIPGIVVIWPLVLWRWMRIETRTERWTTRYKPPRAIHLPVAIIVAAALGFAVISGIAVRQNWPVDIAPEKLSEAEQ